MPVDELDKKIIARIQGDLSLEPRPFAAMADDLGISEDEYIGRIRELKRKGIIRRFGATLRHQEAGFSSNAMVAWIVDEHRMDEVGYALAAFREVTHCYRRTSQSEWPYNLYTMIHASTREDCLRLAEKMSETVGVEDYILLFSEKEFKKTTMEYF